MNAWKEISEEKEFVLKVAVNVTTSFRTFISPSAYLVHFLAFVFYYALAAKRKDFSVTITDDLLRPYWQLNGVHVHFQILCEQ